MRSRRGKSTLDCTRPWIRKSSAGLGRAMWSWQMREARCAMATKSRRFAPIRAKRPCSDGGGAEAGTLAAGGRASQRRSFDCSYFGDSGMPRRIQKVASAGSTPIRYILRQASGPLPPINSHTPEARMAPRPAPHCMRPPPLPRAWSGHSSATIDAPVAHSDPIATPTIARSTRSSAGHPKKRFAFFGVPRLALLPHPVLWIEGDACVAPTEKFCVIPAL